MLSLLMLAVTACGGSGAPGPGAGNSIQGGGGVSIDYAVYQSAHDLYLAGDSQGAVAALQAFLAGYPDSPLVVAAHYYLGRSCYDIDDLLCATGHFGTILSRYGQGKYADGARYWRGRSYHRSALYDLARQDYLALLADFPASSWVDNTLLQIGVSYLDQGDAVNARSWIMQVLNDYPASGSADDAQYQLGRSYELEQRYAEAIAAWQKLAIPNSASTLADNAHYRIGRAYYDQGRYPEALVWFAGLLGPTPTALYVDYSAADTAQYYTARSVHRMAADPLHYPPSSYPEATFAAARSAYATFLAAYPDHSLADNAAYRAARSWYDEGNYVEALARLRAVLAATFVDSSAFDNVQYYIGRSLQQMARDPLAYPPASYPEATFASARAAYALLDSSYPASLLRDNARFRIGLSYYDEAAYNQALAEFAVLITAQGTPLYPDYSALDEAWFYRGRSWHQLGDAVAARAAYDQVVAQYGGSSVYADNAHYQLGKLDYDQGNWAAARSAFESLVKPALALPYVDDSAHDQAWYFLGRTYEQLATAMPDPNFYPLARDAYQSLIARYPASFYLPAAQTRLAALP